MKEEEIGLRWFLDGANRPEMKNRKGDLARAMGIRAGAISEILAGARDMSFLEGMKARAFFTDLFEDEIVEAAAKETVQLVGYVGAGAAAILFSEGDDPREMVRAPEGATKDTVAVEVRGESLGALFDRWLVFYDQVRLEPTASMMGRLCVVGLADGRILVKQIKKGQIDKHYHLFSNTEPPIYDVIVDWAAIVKQMSPR